MPRLVGPAEAPRLAARPSMGRGRPLYGVARGLSALRVAGWVAALGTAGCAPPTPAPVPEFFDPGAPITVQDVRRGFVELGRTVTLNDLVVTLGRAPGGRDLWLSAPEGGEYAGLRVFLNSPRPELLPRTGQRMSLQGTVGSRAGHILLLMEEYHLAAVGGEGSVAPSRIGPVADYGPWVDGLVEIDEAQVLDCGDAAGLQALQVGQGAPLSFDGWSAGVALEAGEGRAGLSGLLQATNTAVRLRARSVEDSGQQTHPAEGAGCVADPWGLALHPREGWARAEGLVVSAVDRGAEAAYLQPAGGGPGLRLRAAPPLSIAALIEAGTLVEGAVVDVEGVLQRPGGLPELLLLQAEALRRTGEAAPTPWPLAALLRAIEDRRGAEAPDTASPDTASPDTASPDTASPDTASPEPEAPSGPALPRSAPAHAALVSLGPLVTGPAIGRWRVGTTLGLPLDGRIPAADPPARAVLNDVIGVMQADLLDEALLLRRIDEASLAPAPAPAP